MSKGALKNGSRDHFNSGMAAQNIYVTAGVKVTISFRQKTCISLDNISPLFSEMISGRGIFSVLLKIAFAIVYGFKKMFIFDCGTAVKISYRAGNFQYSGVCPRA
jgi:hypothetical protein